MVRRSSLPATVDVALQQDTDTGNDEDDGDVVVLAVVPDNELDDEPVTVPATTGDGDELCCRSTCNASLSTATPTTPN